MLLVALLLRPIGVAAADDLVLAGASGHLVMNPATLELRFEPIGRKQVQLSAARSAPLRVANLTHADTTAEWSLPEANVRVVLRLEQDAVSVRFVASQPGTFTWPRIVDPAIQAWALPLSEGAYVPADNAKWISHLAGRGPSNTTADLGLPFWGLQFADFSISVVLPNPFNNELHFEDVAGRLGAALTHQFTRTQKIKDYSVRFRVGGSSDIEAARHYRQWLIARGEFVSLNEKIQHTPAAAKLPGAAHIYLWGQDTITADDITDWKGFARRLKMQGEASVGAPGKRLWSLLKPEMKPLVSKIANAAERPDRYMKLLVVEALNEVLARADFYDAAEWQGANLDAATRELANRSPAELSQADVCRLNSRLLFAAFPACLATPENWGDGVSPGMIRQLADAGFDRLWLGSGSWGGFLKRPETVELAKRLGLLIGPYDSYHSIHRPDEPGSWETAQFDAELYERGAIIMANGKKKAGFKQKGRLLSPLVAQPYVETRVTKLMAVFRANSWFIDCDGFGQYYDDYAGRHPASQWDDVQARLARMSWIRDCFGAVIGTEGCSSPVASTIHFAHGVMTPGIGWDDADMKNKQSPYFQGSYYPPNEPGLFFKPIPLKEAYHYHHFDPRFRLPLFEAVFHDSVVATHHWGSGSFKYRDETKTNQLLELLYGVPPLWHLNLAEFHRRRAEMKRYYGLFSPLHREVATLPLISFECLTADRLVQRTVFADRVEVIANFRHSDYSDQKTVVGGQSVIVRRHNSESPQCYSP